VEVREGEIQQVDAATKMVQKQEEAPLDPFRTGWILIKINTPSGVRANCHAFPGEFSFGNDKSDLICILITPLQYS